MFLRLEEEEEEEGRGGDDEGGAPPDNEGEDGKPPFLVPALVWEREGREGDALLLLPARGEECPTPRPKGREEGEREEEAREEEAREEEAREEGEGEALSSSIR